MVEAYILIQTEVGKAQSVASALREIPGVARADAVTGAYDVIALTESRCVDSSGNTVLSRVQQVPGIMRTVACSVLSLPPDGPLGRGGPSGVALR